MALSTTALDQLWVGGVDLIDEVDHPLGLGIVRVQIVVIDVAPEHSNQHKPGAVELIQDLHCVWVGFLSLGKGDGDERFAQNPAEDTITERAVLVENFAVNRFVIERSCMQYDYSLANVPLSYYRRDTVRLVKKSRENAILTAGIW